jgi:hypothetical protein
MIKSINNATAPKPVATAPENGKKVETVIPLVPVKDEPKEARTIAAPGRQLTDLPPVEDRVLKVQQLFDLITKREKLHESLKKLQSIKTSTESRDLKITIEDSANEWETFNTDAIKACIDAMKDTIKRKLEEVETQIHF